MNRKDMENFATEWIANWNARDLDAILAHFADDARFISPLATQVAGTPIIKGKDALRAYWSKALETATDLHFTLISAICDIECQILSVHYLAEHNGQARRSLETMRFVDGWQVEGESFSGAQEAGIQHDD